MPTNTYTALATQTLGTAASSVTFSSIPQGYTDLQIVIKSGSGVSANTRIQVGNGTVDTGTNYSLTQLYGDGSGAASLRGSNLAYGYGGVIQGGGVAVTNLMNYSNTTTNKTWISRGSAGTYVDACVSMWRSTAAINTLTITNDGGNYPIGSTFTIYGIAAASVGAKATGGTIYSDSLYYYHVFSGNGTFTPASSLTADVLVVAGGGGGANNIGGGGGAGGLLAFTSQSLSATGYTCTVGSGGAGFSGTGTQGNGTVGVDSQFGALTLVKGGGYGAVGDVNGGTGGSGGGTRNSTPVGGSATSGQGYAGNNATVSASSGGGGGAGAIGSQGNASSAGAGGVGLSTYNSWSLATGFGQNVSGTYYFAGGGGGGGYSVTPTSAGLGGYGGGGAGSNVTNSGSNSGTPNTGGGGGGAGAVTSGTSTGGNGGSGVVIVRYAK